MSFVWIPLLRMEGGIFSLFPSACFYHVLTFSLLDTKIALRLIYVFQPCIGPLQSCLKGLEVKPSS
jgi:hypothetical protein